MTIHKVAPGSCAINETVKLAHKDPLNFCAINVLIDSSKKILGAVLMVKAKKKTGRQQSRRGFGAGQAMTNAPLRLADKLHWEPNRYAYVVGRNVLIAAVALGISYAALGDFGLPFSPTKITAADKASMDQKSAHKAKQASVSRAQTKNASKEAPQSAPTASGTTAFISDNNVFIRESPRLSSKILGRAIFGTSIDVLAIEGGWAQIRSSAQNLSGWTEKARLNF